MAEMKTFQAVEKVNRQNGSKSVHQNSKLFQADTKVNRRKVREVIIGISSFFLLRRHYIRRVMRV